MTTITTRAGKGSPLTNTEVDDNFSNLNSAKYESGSNPVFGNVNLESTTGVAERYLQIGSSAIDTNAYAYIDFTGDTTYYDYGLRLMRGNSGPNTNSTLTHKGTGDFYTNLPEGNNSVIFNEGGYDTDFRVESNDNAHMLFVEASTNRVGIGISSNLHGNRLNIEKSDSATDGPEIVLKNLYRSSTTTAGELGSITFGGWRDVESTGSYVAAISGHDTTYPGTSGQLKFFVNGNGSSDPSAVRADAYEMMRITDTEVVVNETSNDVDFRVESNDNANMFTVDGDANRVTINSGGNDENNALLVSAGVTHLNGHKFIKAPAWGAWAQNTAYYLFSFNPASNGAAAAATINLSAGGVEHYAVFNLVARNASGTTTVAGYCTGGSTSMFNLIGYRDNTDATTVHFYVKPTINVYFTPTARISGTGSAVRLSSAPSSPVDEDYTYSSGTTYNHKLTSGTGLRVNSAYDDGILLKDARTSASSTRFNSDIKFENYHSDSMVLGIEHNDWSPSYRRGYIKFNGTTDSANTVERITLTVGETVINEESGDYDFRVEGNNNTHLVYGDATNDRVGVRTNTPNSALEVAGDIAFRQLRSTNSGSHSSSSDGRYWALGEITLSGSQSAHITLYGTDSYSAGGAVVGKSTLMMRGNNANTTIQTMVYTETTGGLPIRDARWINIATNQYRIYVAVGTFAGLENVVVSGGTWVPNLANTGLTSLPSSYGYFATNRTDYIGDLAHPTVTYSNAEVVFNNNGQDRDFRVESDDQSHMFFVDASADMVNIGTSLSTGLAVQSSQTGIQLTSSGRIFCSNADHHDFNRTSNGDIIRFRRNAVIVGGISSTTSGTTYNTTSDRRLKDNIETITDGTDKLMSMNPVTHGWKADPEADTVHGFIAQEMLDIVPEAVSGDPEGDEMMSMDYGRITPVLVAALQDAHKKIAELETRLNELEVK